MKLHEGKSFCKGKDTTKRAKMSAYRIGHYTLKIPIIKFKNEYKSKQKILNKEISNGQETFREMVNIPRHQENANQNFFSVPCYTFLNG
jgi:hypothetical protein